MGVLEGGAVSYERGTPVERGQKGAHRIFGLGRVRPAWWGLCARDSATAWDLWGQGLGIGVVRD